MSQRISAIVLDATVLSNFASTDSIDWLTATFDRLRTVPAVETELKDGYKQDYTFLEHALEAIAADEIQITPAHVDLHPVSEDNPILQTLDRGEAEAVFAAAFKRHQGDQKISRMLATDDRDARRLAQNPPPDKWDPIPVTGSLGLLARGIEQGDLSVETADEWLTTWVDEYGYRSPVDSITELLPDADE